VRRGPTIALAALATSLVLAAVLATTRAAALDAPHAAALPTPTLAAQPDAPRATTKLCVEGAGDAIAATQRPLLTAGTLDPAALRATARLAFTADRTAEREHGGPAWPQRMGAAADPKPTCIELTAP
jgi:hypothetical protein